MKNIIINNDLLKKALQKLKGIIDKKTHLPVLTNLYMKAKHNCVELMASDLEVTSIIELKLEADNPDEFQILIPFELLTNISNVSGSEPIQILTDETRVTIKVSHDQYEISSLDDIKEYPALPAFPESEPLAMVDDFAVWLNKSIPSISLDTLRPAMTKICLDIKGTALTIVTTDAHSLFTKSFEVPKQKAEKVLISPKVAKSLSGFELIHLSWNNTHVIFKSEDITILAKRCDEKFPNYKAVIPEKESNVSFNRVDLITALEKVLLTADSSLTVKFLLKSKESVVKIESADIDYLRSSSTEVAGDYTGNCECVAVNVKGFIRTLNQVHFDEISLAIDTASSPILLRSTSDATYLGLVMPFLLIN